MLLELYNVPLLDIVHVDLTGQHTYHHCGNNSDNHPGK